MRATGTWLPSEHFRYVGPRGGLSPNLAGVFTATQQQAVRTARTTEHVLNINLIWSPGSLNPLKYEFNLKIQQIQLLLK